MPKTKKRKKKEAGNGYGVAGFILGLTSLFYTCAMVYMRGTPPLILLFFGLTMGLLGIVFCSIQIVNNSSKIWTIISIISMIPSILGSSVNILLASKGNFF